MRIATWNVNSIKQLAWLTECRPDLVCLQDHSDVDIETAITALGREPGRGLVVMPDQWMLAHRALIIAAAARTKVPAV
jgi:putative ABC transport system substrate-binding protein